MESYHIVLVILCAITIGGFLYSIVLQAELVTSLKSKNKYDAGTAELYTKLSETLLKNLELIRDKARKKRHALVKADQLERSIKRRLRKRRAIEDDVNVTVITSIKASPTLHMTPSNHHKVIVNRTLTIKTNVAHTSRHINAYTLTKTAVKNNVSTAMKNLSNTISETVSPHSTADFMQDSSLKSIVSTAVINVTQIFDQALHTATYKDVSVRATQVSSVVNSPIATIKESWSSSEGSIRGPSIRKEIKMLESSIQVESHSKQNHVLTPNRTSSFIVSASKKTTNPESSRGELSQGYTDVILTKTYKMEVNAIKTNCFTQTVYYSVNLTRVRNKKFLFTEDLGWGVKKDYYVDAVEKSKKLEATGFFSVDNSEYKLELAIPAWDDDGWCTTEMVKRNVTYTCKIFIGKVVCSHYFDHDAQFSYIYKNPNVKVLDTRLYYFNYNETLMFLDAEAANYDIKKPTEAPNPFARRKRSLKFTSNYDLYKLLYLKSIGGEAPNREECLTMQRSLGKADDGYEFKVHKQLCWNIIKNSYRGDFFIGNKSYYGILSCPCSEVYNWCSNGDFKFPRNEYAADNAKLYGVWAGACAKFSVQLASIALAGSSLKGFEEVWNQFKTTTRAIRTNAQNVLRNSESMLQFMQETRRNFNVSFYNFGVVRGDTLANKKEITKLVKTLLGLADVTYDLQQQISRLKLYAQQNRYLAEKMQIEIDSIRTAVLKVCEVINETCEIVKINVTLIDVLKDGGTVDQKIKSIRQTLVSQKKELLERDEKNLRTYVFNRTVDENLRKTINSSKENIRRMDANIKYVDKKYNETAKALKDIEELAKKNLGPTIADNKGGNNFGLGGSLNIGKLGIVGGLFGGLFGGISMIVLCIVCIACIAKK